MKRTISLMILLAGLSAVSGYMMSKASWISKVGMTLFYREYNLLKIWWQGACAVFLLMMLLFLVHHLIQKKVPFWGGKFIHLLLIAAAAGGLYLTYDDFTTEMAHKLLGWRFHYGFYLIWIEWILIGLYFMTKGRDKIAVTTDTNKREPVMI